MTIAELQRLARAAAVAPVSRISFEDGTPGMDVHYVNPPTLTEREAVRDFHLACSPERILALIAAVEVLQDTTLAGISWAPPETGQMLRDRLVSALDAFTGHGEAVAPDLESRS